MGTFKQNMLDIAPPWLQTGEGGNVLRALGDAMDALVQRNKEAVMSRFPHYASAGALTAIGGDRQLVRGPGDTDTTYAARLVNAWTTWAWAGTPYGLLNQLYDMGYTSVKIITQAGNTYSLDGSRNVVVVAGAQPLKTFPNFWNTFNVWFGPTLPAAWVSGGVPAESSPEAQGIKQVISRWRPSFALVQYILINTGPFWGIPQTQTWGQAGLTWSSAGTVWGP